MPKIDLHRAPRAGGSRYPAPHDEPCRGRFFLQLGVAAELEHALSSLLVAHRR